MATTYKNLSSYDPATVPNGKDMTIGIVVSEWNEKITNALLESACTTLITHGVNKENILIDFVPGSFEVVFGARNMADGTDVDAVIVLGCVIQGDTPHFDYVCQGVTAGITELNVKYALPFIFGLLTTNTMQQAEDRAGGKHGNKGDECAIVALKMVELSKKYLDI